MVRFSCTLFETRAMVGCGNLHKEGESDSNLLCSGMARSRSISFS